MTELLALSDVGVGWGARTVLSGVDLRVRAGETWAVLGPNGTGKSTLLKAVLGVGPWLRGEALLLGAPRAAWDAAALAREVAWVPQAFEPAEGFSALELVLMGRAPHLGLWGLPSAADAQRAREVMASLDVGGLADRPAEALSGGERRMLLLARALVQAPRLLLLDEPTAFLDLHHQVLALERVRAEADAGHVGAVAVLHDVNLAAAWCTHALLVRGGRVVASGPTEDVLEPARLEAVYGVPLETARAESGARLFAPRARHGRGTRG